MASCAICPRTADEGQHACPLHAAEMREWLAELPAQARLLEQFVAPGSRPPASRTGGTGRAHSPVPVDLRVLVLLGPGRYDPTGADDDGVAPIRAVLGAWAGHITYHYPAATRDAHGAARTMPCEQAWPAKGETITGWCVWLLGYLPFALTLPLVADLHAQLGDLIHRIRDLTHAVPHRHHKVAGCPKCQAFDLAAVDGQEGITCFACGHHLTDAEYDQHAAASLRTYREAADGAAA
ncbi:hypothetical protein [Streptomyces chartreusis]|uniref:hypothetical protein n=1 Tax=Streptomyces chartreusis TaxID=1969 RepID=UPI0037F5BDDB